MSTKTYKIGNKELSIPETKLKQYKRLNRLIKENLSGLDLNKDKEKLVISLGSIISELLEKDAVEELLAVIFDYDDPSVFEDITEDTLIEVLKDFFSGKVNLINSTMDSFKQSQISETVPVGN